MAQPHDDNDELQFARERFVDAEMCLSLVVYHVGGFRFNKNA